MIARLTFVLVLILTVLIGGSFVVNQVRAQWLSVAAELERIHRP